jgi:hypothetical protein
MPATPIRLRGEQAIRDFFDTEIVAAFFPGGQPASDHAAADALVDRLCAFAPAEAMARLKTLRAAP